MRKKPLRSLFTLVLIVILVWVLAIAVPKIIKKEKRQKKGGIERTTTTVLPGRELGGREGIKLTALPLIPEAEWNEPFAIFPGGVAPSAINESGASMIRLTMQWETLEPTKNNYNDDAIKQQMEQVNRMGTDVVVSIRTTSSWGGFERQKARSSASSRRFTGYPRDIEAWKNMMTHFVESVDGDGKEDIPGLERPVKYWQIENEWVWMWIDTPERYIDLLRVTSETIKAADPEAKVVAAALTGVPTLAFAEGYIDDRDSFLLTQGDQVLNVRANQIKPRKEFDETKSKYEMLLRDGGKYFDIIDIHYFSRDPYVLPSSNEWVLDLAKKYGAPTRMWSLENSGPFIDYTPEEQSTQVVTRTILGVMSGMEKTFWSSMVPIPGYGQDQLNTALIDEKGRKKPAFYTYQLMAQETAGMSKIKDLGDQTNVFFFELSGKSGKRYIGWTRTGEETVDVPSARSSVTVKKIITEPEKTSPETEKIDVKGGSAQVTLTTIPVIMD